tara:strand:+ start:11189 stop:12772 length:1584 start_codon:yes stop_codon:yes gene_type:complete
MGFNMNIDTHKNLSNDRNEHAITLTPNITFSSDILKVHSLHIVFNVDISGSMLTRVPNGKTYSKSRIQLTKECLKEAVMFLYTMVTEGKEVYISIVTFNNSANNLVSKKAIINNDDCITLMKIIDEIHARGTTNIGSAILNTIDICNELEVDKTYKILISDGYITTGVVGVSQIKQDYKGFYNSSIGIGNELQYDKDLLQALSEECEERACYDSNEMKEQIIDSVYSNVSKIADSVAVSEDSSIVSKINTCEEVNTIHNDMKFTTKLFWITDKDSSSVKIKNVPVSYLKSGGYDISESPVSSSLNNINIGEITINLIPCKDSDFADIEFYLELSVKETYKSNKMEKSFRKIQNFIDITNQIMNLDIDNPETISQNYKNNKNIYDKIISLIKYIRECDANDINNYMIGVLDKFKTSIKPYTDEHCADYILNPAVATPLRMARTQTSSGSYAFVGRQVSMGYSMGIADFQSDTDDDVVNSVNSPELSPLIPPAPTLNIPAFSLYGNHQNMGYFGTLTPPATPSPQFQHS